MRLLLDTHIFIWFVMNPGQLSSEALAAIQNAENQIFLSLASAWEMSIKSGLGKLQLTQPIEVFFQDQAQRNRFEILPITLKHIAAVETLPQLHGDLFDRLLIAQSISEGLRLISADHAFSLYPVNLLW
jgi:PIN domain nuclease of toxin-antitoxin system